MAAADAQIQAEGATASPSLPTTHYVPFGGAPAQDMLVWDGQHVAYLVQPGSEFTDPVIMGRILDDTDRAYEWFQFITGQEPQPYAPTLFNGHGTIAILPETGGAGFGYLGYTGIEILNAAPPYDYGHNLYVAAQNGQFDHIPLYELGRNFWLFGDQLGPLGAMVNGFAAANDFLAADHAGLHVIPINGQDYDAVRQHNMLDLFGLYLGDPNASWHMLVPENGNGYESITVQGQQFTAGDLAGSFLYRIWSDWGDQTYADFWHDLAGLGHAGTPEQARDNFLDAAKQATGEDYGYLFKEAGTVVTPPAKPPVTPPSEEHIDWNALAALVTANFEKTGQWYTPSQTHDGEGGGGGGGQTEEPPPPPATVDWNALAAQATANFETTGHWFV